MNSFVEWGALANILIFGLIIGAGLPTLYALGVRSLDSSTRASGRRVTLYKASAYACFAVVVLVILRALVFIATGGQ